MCSRSRRSNTSAHGVSCPSSPPAHDALASRQWQAWRSAAGKVTRVWNEWLAADIRERDRLFPCYLRALADEEQAAADLECAIHPEPKGKRDDQWLADSPSGRRDL